LEDTIAVEIVGVTYRYGDFTAVDDLSLDIPRGEFFALLGPNGAGKTTLLNMLMTLTAPTKGSVSIMGHDVVREVAAVRRELGIVFQDPALDERLTAAENLEIHTVLYGIPRNERQAKIRQTLAWASLDNVDGRPVRTFSGGMKRRLELGRALMHGPHVLLLDEPTLGLDPQGRRHLWDRIAALREKGMTVLMTTHNLSEAEACDRVGIVDRGRLVAIGEPAALIAEHSDSETGSLEDVFIALTGRQLFEENASARDRMVSFAKQGGEHTR
jgi:ABC-2 type transport system ATP-binding protein